MSSISMVEANLPPGFRFHPRDEELVCEYLMKKVSNNTHPHHLSLLFIEVDLNKCEPWELPGMACVGGKNDWYFYSKKDKKYATGLRTNRATASGYWKATGKDRCVRRKGSLVGMRKTLVFYQGRAPKGTKTDWVMHEFRLEGPLAPPKLSPPKEDWVLCRVFYKNSNEIKPNPNINAINYHHHAAATSSSSLPPLIDSYLSFDQPKLDYDEQAPCFSIFAQNQTNSVFPSQFGHQIEPNMLDQISKVERNCRFRGSPSFGEVSSRESYLSDVGMSNNMWTSRY